MSIDLANELERAKRELAALRSVLAKAEALAAEWAAADYKGEPSMNAVYHFAAEELRARLAEYEMQAEE